MTDTEQFFVRICGCGVVHLCFGPSVVNVTLGTALAITETLKEVMDEAFRRARQAGQPVDANAATSSESNVVFGHFPSSG
jgi:hypothetical protein